MGRKKDKNDTRPKFCEVRFISGLATNLPISILDLFSVPSSHVITHHYVHQLGDGLDVGPYPFLVGLWINAATGHTNGHTPWGLQGVNLEEMKSSKQMLWVAILWEGVFFPEHEPHLARNEQARAKGLVEGTNLGRRCCVWAWELVHDVPCVGHKVGSGTVAVKPVLPQLGCILCGTLFY